MGKGHRRRGRPIVEGISDAQRRTLEAIRELDSAMGYPPTIQELAESLGISTASAHEQVGRLVQKGYVRREPGKARSLAVVGEPEHQVSELVPIPIVGMVKAGPPLLAEENLLGELLVDRHLVRHGRHFALTVVGDSMNGAGIYEGDVVIVRQQPVAESGDIVVALLGEDATVKRLSIHDDRIELIAANPLYPPTTIGPDEDLRVIGRVVSIRRSGRPPDH